MKFRILVFLTLLACNTNAFIPKSLIDSAFRVSDLMADEAFGFITKSLTHEEILRRGVIKSVAKFFYDQPGGKYKVDLTKIESDYYHDVRRLYNDYYGSWFCHIPLNDLLRDVLQKMVVNVDLNDETKDLPYAHFDAEKFRLSNDRVIAYRKLIIKEIKAAGYIKAAKLSGIILHTIHDFYSHSNWVEMGNHYKLNKHIGKKSFNNLPIATKKDVACYDNCELVEKSCNHLSHIVMHAIKLLQSDLPLTCPIKYYNCTNNVALKTKLSSGFYVDQKLSDGTLVLKPENKKKCSHGGIQDTTSFIKPRGGINKDSGFLILSPHAHLHQIAADLAIRHTEYFFNDIRKNVGDEQFAKFLKLKKSRFSITNEFNNYVQLCGASRVSYTFSIFNFFITALVFGRYFY